MRALAVIAAVFVVCLEEAVEWRYGAAGVVGLLLLTIGIKVENSAVSSAGAVVLALLVARPAL